MFPIHLRGVLMKKIICLLTVAILVVSCFFLMGCSKGKLEYNKELVINSNLENLSTNWLYLTDDDAKITADEKTLTEGTSEYEEEGSKHGRRYIGVNSKSVGSYGYFTQQVRLDKNAYYVLSCDIKVTTNVESNGGLSAFVGLAESDVISCSLKTTTSGWQTVEVCFRNNAFDIVNVRFGLGTDLSRVTSGYAYFDNISLKKIQDPSTEAAGLVIFDLGRKGASGFSSSYNTTNEGIIFTTLLVVLGACLIYVSYVVYRRLKSKNNLIENNEAEENKAVSPVKKFFTSSGVLITISAIIAFVIRLILSMTLYGHGANLNELTISANGFAKDGLISHYFESNIYYTPGVSYILWIFGLISKSLGLLSGSLGMAIFLKIPAIVADLVIVFMIYLIASKKMDNVKAFVISLVYGLVPAVFIASSVYSSYLSIGILFLMLALMNARDKKIIKLTVYYTLSVLFIAETLWILPLLIAYIVVVYVKNPETRIKIPVSITVSIIVSYLITLPLSFNFFAQGRPFIVLERYFSIFAQNKFFTDGAFNVYAMCGQSGYEANVAGIVMSAILASIGMLYSIALYIKCRDRQKLILLAGYTMLFIFTFCIRMNPLVSLIPLSILFLYALLSGERRILTTTASLAIISTLSMCYELMICKYVPGGANASEITMSAVDPVAIIFSILTVISTLIMGYVVFMICAKKENKTVQPMECNYIKYIQSWFNVKPSNNDTDSVK